MDIDSVKELFKRELSLVIVTRLLNIIEFNSFEDLVRNYYRTCELKKMYDCLFSILHHHRFKEIEEGYCNMCSNSTDKTNSCDVVEGMCPCNFLERYKFNLQVHLELYEGYDESVYNRFLDRYRF